MLPITPFSYRVLVVLSAVLALGSSMLNPIFLPPLPIGHSALMVPGTETVFVTLGVLNLLLGTASTVGLCLYWRWSRPASLVCILLSVITYAMSAYFVDSGVKVAVDWLSSLLGGAALSMAYFSPIALRFGPKHSVYAAGRMP